MSRGSIPHVITEDGKDGFELETIYEETDVDISSVNPEELKKCLYYGQVPDAYKDVKENMRVEEVRRKVKDHAEDEIASSIYGTPEEMLEKAKEGYFFRDSERNLVYCPMGEILRQKCIRKNVNIRYAKKMLEDAAKKEISSTEGKESSNKNSSTKGCYEKNKGSKVYIKTKTRNNTATNVLVRAPIWNN